MYDLKDTGSWERITIADDDDNGSGGSCGECGHFDGDDGGRYMRDFYCDVESASLILCPDCYHEALTAALTAALKQARTSWGHLHDMVSDMVEGDRLTEAMIPDDYLALISSLIGCAKIDDETADAVAQAESQ